MVTGERMTIISEGGIWILGDFRKLSFFGPLRPYFSSIIQVQYVSNNVIIKIYNQTIAARFLTAKKNRY